MSTSVPERIGVYLGHRAGGARLASSDDGELSAEGSQALGGRQAYAAGGASDDNPFAADACRHRDSESNS